jgi:hypothetical protein
MVPGVQVPDSSHRAFRRAGHRSHSLDGRQNRYSYVTTCTATGFSGEAMGLKPPWSCLRIPRWYPPFTPEVVAELETQAEAKFHMYSFVCVDGLMKPQGSVGVVRRWYSVCTDPVCGCFDNPEGLNNGHLPSRRGLRVHELANGVRHGTTVLS